MHTSTQSLRCAQFVVPTPNATSGRPLMSNRALAGSAGTFVRQARSGSRQSASMGSRACLIRLIPRPDLCRNSVKLSPSGPSIGAWCRSRRGAAGCFDFLAPQGRGHLWPLPARLLAQAALGTNGDQQLETGAISSHEDLNGASDHYRGCGDRSRPASAPGTRVRLVRVVLQAVSRRPTRSHRSG